MNEDRKSKSSIGDGIAWAGPHELVEAAFLIVGISLDAFLENGV